MTTQSGSVLGSHINAEATTELLSDPPRTFTYYHAGPLFNIGELQNNVRLSSMIQSISEGRYQPILPQDLEQRDTTPHSIRDSDIRALLNCDLALFTYDGSELDSGTVVEYMVAKFADMPAVILRSDFRGSGDQGDKGDPWNLMTSFWPRTAGVVVNAMLEYKNGLADASTAGQVKDAKHTSAANQHAGDKLVEATARRVVAGFDEVLKRPARLPKDMRETVYRWLALMPGFKDGTDSDNVAQMLNLLQTKEEKGLL